MAVCVRRLGPAQLVVMEMTRFGIEGASAGTMRSSTPRAARMGWYVLSFFLQSDRNCAARISMTLRVLASRG